jgi:hypothetical protein
MCLCACKRFIFLSAYYHNNIYGLAGNLRDEKYDNYNVAIVDDNDASLILDDKFVSSTRKLIVSVESPNVSRSSHIDQNHSQ